MVTPLGLKYIPYTYMHPLGWVATADFRGLRKISSHGTQVSGSPATQGKVQPATHPAGMLRYPKESNDKISGTKYH